MALDPNTLYILEEGYLWTQNYGAQSITKFVPRVNLGYVIGSDIWVSNKNEGVNDPISPGSPAVRITKAPPFATLSEKIAAMRGGNNFRYRQAKDLWEIVKAELLTYSLSFFNEDAGPDTKTYSVYLGSHPGMGPDGNRYLVDFAKAEGIDIVADLSTGHLVVKWIVSKFDS